MRAENRKLYDPKEPDNPVVTEARCAFLQTISDRPHARRIVLEALRDDVLPIHLQGSLSGTKAAVKEWARACRLFGLRELIPAGTWTLYCGLDTVALWASWEKGRRDLIWDYPTEGGWVHTPEQAPLSSLQFETEAEAEATWRAYRARVRDSALKSGLRPVVEKREYMHFEWLVRSQIEGETAREISMSAGATEEAVKIARSQLAKLIDLPPLPKGRQRKG